MGQFEEARGHQLSLFNNRCRFCGVPGESISAVAAAGGTPTCLGQPAPPRQRRARVYIAGPYSQGEPATNVQRAIDAADALLSRGYAPYVPHLTHYWHAAHPHPYEEWMQLDFEWVKVCDCVLRLPGHSLGADREVAEAERLGLPIYLSLDTLVVCEPPSISA